MMGAEINPTPAEGYLLATRCFVNHNVLLDEVNLPGVVFGFQQAWEQLGTIQEQINELDSCFITTLVEVFAAEGIPFPSIPDETEPLDPTNCEEEIGTLTSRSDDPWAPFQGPLDITFDSEGNVTKIEVR